ncbi:MAG TPA: glutathione peroxidase [Bdellovibrionota bacterium]|jgi:glutathione peroxidase|nr:glutathione peroxidase [Bdellovibrionota bacterium]
MKMPLYEMLLRRIDGTPTSLAAFEGKVLLMVNVASECGLTPQYSGLEELYEKYRDRGFEVLGFPANEFGAQEPGTNAQIQEFCRTKFGARFPMFEKIVVKGKGIHPLYKYLTETKPVAPGKPDITWNFEKFLINRKGEVVERFSPKVEPTDISVVSAVERELTV